MKRTIAALVTLLLISISVNASAICNMPEKFSTCSDMLHIAPVSNSDSDDCCSISADNFEKETSFQKKSSFDTFIVSISFEYEHITQFQRFIPVNYKLNYAYPPPLKTIKLLC